MSVTPSKKDSVHRLVDMVVEEVSLVDRAANKQRFLVVKRNAPMPMKKPTPPPKTKKDDDEEEADVVTNKPSKAGKPGKPGARSGAAKADTAEAIATATALLERLTDAVDTLREASGEDADEILIELASELSEAAAELAEAAGVAEDEEEETETEKGAVGETIAKVRAILAEVSSMLKTRKATEGGPTTAAPAPTAAPSSSQTSSAEGRVVEQLASVASSLHALTDAVKDQGQRLGRLEKGIALPNSRAHDERPPARDADVGWPLDLNRPLDRESVDKSTSFHDR